LDEWTLVVVLLGSIVALTGLATIIVRPKFKGNIAIAVASILGIFAGVAGASHGPGEILQGDRAPSGIIIEAWPELTSLGGEPAMTLIPNFRISGIVTIILGSAVTIWAATGIQSKKGSLVLISLSVTMLFVGGGLIPPILGVTAGIIHWRLIANLKASSQKL
jgi:hypothetical protein